ncbi:hypothetical protein FRC08_011797 [Ceratobasidium sp. 394]|nr:hypothetical protein FRC08_011797 [Ceratobasidium sp. 394]KAG9102068.1 hypothetical protein FS749_016256 [Ceratobasidium sp. UAMH 11750]
MINYIVVFKESATKAEIDGYIARIEESGGKIKYHYDTLMKAIAASIPDSLVQSFRQEKDVIDFMEPDGVATAQGGGGAF